MNKPKFYIWRDSVDLDMYHLGVKYSVNDMSHMCSLYADQVIDIFSEDDFKEITTSPKEVIGFDGVKLK